MGLAAGFRHGEPNGEGQIDGWCSEGGGENFPSRTMPKKREPFIKNGAMIGENAKFPSESR